jgi:hypothetical protein
MTLISPAVYREHDPGVSLGDDALQRVIDANEAYMVRILGPHARVGSPAVEVIRGGTASLFPRQPVGSVLTVEEQNGGDTTWYTRAANDYLLIDGGLTVRRLSTGDNAASRWASLVRLTYVPRHNLEERILALLELVGTDVATGVNSGGLMSRTMGSWSESYGSGPTGRDATKDAILSRLHPTGGIVLA